MWCCRVDEHTPESWVVDASATALQSPVRGLLALVHDLRAAGLPVGLTREEAFLRSVAAVGLDELGQLHLVGRVTLVSHPNHLRTYDEVFWKRFGAEPAGRAVGGPQFSMSGKPPQSNNQAVPQLYQQQRAKPGQDEQEVALALASSTEILGDRDFRTLQQDDWDELERVLASLRLRFPERRTHRRERARRGRDLDLRRTLREAARTDGELIRRHWRRRRTRQRRIVFLLDVSASMEDYARALLIFAHILAVRHAAVEVFCFGTRLTRVTDLARIRDTERCLATVAARARDWRTGTRIGQSLGTFVSRFGRPGMARGAVVVVCSDGLEQDDPEALRENMRRLKRLAHRIVWVNPLKRDPRYEPLARGMQAALPSIDTLVSGHNLASLESLAQLLPRLAAA